jgi:hypothetical protein
MDKATPLLSVIVCIHEMYREAPRTLLTLSRNYQKYIDDLSYDITIVDNGSQRPLPESSYRDMGVDVNYQVVADAPASPVRAINTAVRNARGQYVCVMIDGARMLSPGILHYGIQALRQHPLAIGCPYSFHLGSELQSRAVAAGYDQEEEDALLASCPWETDGYRLFDISVFAGSSYRGWFVSPNESNALFLSRRLWDDLAGFDERFATAGGGLANLDLFKRACEWPGAQLYGMLGEGTFHQFHGSTSNLRTSNAGYDAEYARIRGEVFRTTSYPLRLLGHAQTGAAKHLAFSAERLRDCGNDA